MSAERYNLATYCSSNGEPQAGLVVEEMIIDVATALAKHSSAPGGLTYTSVLDILNEWHELQPQLRRIAGLARAGARTGQVFQLSQVQLLAPILYPGTIYCAGANYRDHVAEMARVAGLPDEPASRERRGEPWHFIKASAPCVRGPNSTIALPSFSQQVDWEGEIALVIGRSCRHVSADAALDHAAGLTIVNDLSARDLLRREGLPSASPLRFDWVRSKCFDGALPMGPWICPLDQCEDVHRLGIRLWVNDELMQNSSSANLIFSMAEQIAALSTRVTLRPGDVIATGTPAGVGAARGRFLRAGDRVRVQVDGIGELINDFAN